MTEENTPEEVFAAMTATKVLVAILETLKTADVDLDTFINSNKETRELNISYNDDKRSFTFSLREKENNE